MSGRDAVHWRISVSRNTAMWVQKSSTNCRKGRCASGLHLWFVVCAVAIPATVFLLRVVVAILSTVCGPCRSRSRKISGQERLAMVSKRRGSWIPRKERAERVLAKAVSIDGRKEWTCNFCSESSVWTRWRCRRCYHDIPASLRGKHRNG